MIPWNGMACFVHPASKIELIHLLYEWGLVSQNFIYDTEYNRLWNDMLFCKIVIKISYIVYLFLLQISIKAQRAWFWTFDCVLNWLF